mgnify:FL=1
MGGRSELGTSQRVEIVLMMPRKEEPIATLARRHNVSETTLHRWRDEFFADSPAAMADWRSKQADGQAAEIVRLKKETARRDQVIGDGQGARIGALLDALGVPRSSWYRQAVCRQSTTSGYARRHFTENGQGCSLGYDIAPLWG